VAVLVVVMVSVAVSLALRAGGSTLQLSLQVAFHRLSNAAAGARGRLYAETFKELNGSPAHPAADHHIRLLLLDESRYLSGLVSCEKGIIDDLGRSDLSILHLDQGKKRTAPKMVGYLALQTLIRVR
jgi:hypothetical protein